MNIEFAFSRNRRYAGSNSRHSRLAAARLLGLRTAGIYHTDFVEYVRHLTQDDDLADLRRRAVARHD